MLNFIQKQVMAMSTIIKAMLASMLVLSLVSFILWSMILPEVLGVTMICILLTALVSTFPVFLPQKYQKWYYGEDYIEDVVILMSLNFLTFGATMYLRVFIGMHFIGIERSLSIGLLSTGSIFMIFALVIMVLRLYYTPRLMSLQEQGA